MTVRDADIVRMAQQRATISGWLAQHPGKHMIKDVAAGTGLSHHSTQQRLGQMARDQFVQFEGERAHRRYWMALEGPQRPETSMTMGEDPDAMKAPQKHQNASRESQKPTKVIRAPAHPARDIELVINGTQIVLGRNPLTGRLRITLEEA